MPKIFSDNALIEKLLSFSYVRLCREIIRIVCEGVAGCRLDIASEWKKVLTDDDFCLQINAISIALKIKEGNEHNAICLSAHYVGRYSMSDSPIESIE